MEDAMNTKEIVQKSLQAVEAHLSEPLSAQDLASDAGYSLYHYAHVFRAFVGEPPGVYIRRRRMERAAVFLRSGMSVTDTALAVGFETPSGFSRAFHQYFGQTAQDFKKNEVGGKKMKMKVVELAPMRAIGYEARPQGMESLDLTRHGAYWSTIDNSVYADYHQKTSAAGEIGVWTHPDALSGELAYFFGAVAAADAAIPEGFSELTIPAGKYAKFIVADSQAGHGGAALGDAIRQAWGRIFTKELEEKGLTMAGHSGYCFEFYKGPEVAILIPVQ
jgi:AraC family transcriptional regulator